MIHVDISDASKVEPWLKSNPQPPWAQIPELASTTPLTQCSHMKLNSCYIEKMAPTCPSPLPPILQFIILTSFTIHRALNTKHLSHKEKERAADSRGTAEHIRGATTRVTGAQHVNDEEAGSTRAKHFKGGGARGTGGGLRAREAKATSERDGW